MQQGVNRIKPTVGIEFLITAAHGDWIGEDARAYGYSFDGTLDYSRKAKLLGKL